MAQRSKAPHIDNEQGLRCWTHLVGDGIDARTWSNTPSSSSHAEGIVLDCGHRTATRRIEECTIVDNCSFNVIGMVGVAPPTRPPLASQDEVKDLIKSKSSN